MKHSNGSTIRYDRSYDSKLVFSILFENRKSTFERFLFQAGTVERVIGLFGGSELVEAEGAILLEEERIEDEK